MIDFSRRHAEKNLCQRSNLQKPMTPEQISRCFCNARLAAQALDAYPGGDIPASLEEAYRIQEISVQSWPDRVRGWKIATVASSFRSQYKAERLAGPIFMKSLWMAEYQAVSAPLIENGYGAVKAEVALKIADAIPAEADFTDPIQLLTYIEGAYAAIELAGSPLATLETLGPAAVVSDFGNHLGLIVGPKLSTEVLTHPASTTISMRVNRHPVGSGTAAQVPGGPLSALLFLVEHLRQRGRSLSAGEWVSTGATTGAHPVRAEDEIAAEFGETTSVGAVISVAHSG